MDWLKKSLGKRLDEGVLMRDFLVEHEFLSRVAE